MDYEEAVAQKDKLYSRIKEVRSLLEHCRSGGERLRQTERLRILRDMYRDACAQVDSLRPPQERRRKAPKRRVIHTGVPPTNLHPEGFTFHSSMFQTMKEANIQDSYIKGGKTGFTSDAGLCLASLGEVNGKSYILVTAHADGNHDTDPYHILDAVSVYGQLAEQTQPESITSEDETESEEEGLHSSPCPDWCLL